MNFRIRTLTTVIAAVAAAVSAPAFAEKPYVQVTDDFRLVASHVNSKLASFKGKVNVTSLDGHDDVAAKLNEQIAAAGYNVSAEEPDIRYTVKEIYAGEAEKYTPPADKDGKVSLGAKVDIAASVGLCLIFGSCTNPAVMANEALADAAHVHADLTSKTGVDEPNHDKKPVLIVEYQVCRVGRSCANALIASYNPDLTLDQLRQVTAAKGLSQAINLKQPE
ncbi:hypothetical protein [Ralstonia pseudosolanacearum]|uniref:hypothetical protein n=1 Tax=Ralstonia pseudosolanacearum TaxID=1310165 RepID=UPI003CEE1D85